MVVSSSEVATVPAIQSLPPEVCFSFPLHFQHHEFKLLLGKKELSIKVEHYRLMSYLSNILKFLPNNLFFVE